MCKVKIPNNQAPLRGAWLFGMDKHSYTLDEFYCVADLGAGTGYGAFGEFDGQFGSSDDAAHAPGLDALVHEDHLALFVEEYYVKGEAHEEHMDGIAWVDYEADPVGQRRAEHETAPAG